MNLHEKYFKGKLIGEGYFFKVYIIKDKIKQDFFVLKIAKFSYTSKDHLNSEIFIKNRKKSVYILRFSKTTHPIVK